MAKINRTVFFNLVRQNPFGGKLTQQNVDGTEAILTAWEKSPYSGEPLDGLGYILATAFGETGTMKWDVREIPARGQSREYYFELKYGPQTRVGQNLGNTQPGDGGKFYGRSFCQITGRANYAKFERLLAVPLVAKPDLALEKDNGAAILLHGMYRGLFAGRKLRDYFDGKPYPVEEARRRRIQARRIINGQDKAETFARIAAAFTSALVASSAPANVLSSAAQAMDLPHDSFGLPGVQLPGIPGVLQDLAPAVLNRAVQEATGGKVSLPIDKGQSLGRSTIVGGALVTGIPGVLTTLASVQDKWVAMAIVGLIVGGVLLVVSGRIKIKDEAGV